MPGILSNIIQAIISKKKILAWIATVIIAVLAMIFGVNSSELKEAVCEQASITIPAPSSSGAISVPVK